MTDIGAGAPATGPRAVRRRLDAGPMAPLKLASGCDRRCSFCAIPSFRGSFVSRRPSDVLAGGAGGWPTQGVTELFLVSENSTSYGKDLGDLRLLETLLPELAGIDGIERVRVSYLQPAETRPGLIEAIADTPGVVPYFDLSFQHASATVLRRMRRFGDPESFLGLLEQIRALAPQAGVRSNVIVGFPGETEDDLADPVRLPRGRPDGRHRRLRLLRRGRHRGGGLRRRPSSTRTRSAPAPSTSPPWSRSSTPSGPRSASARRSSCSSSPSTDGDRRGPRRPPGPRGRRHDDARPAPATPRVGDLRDRHGRRHRRRRPDRREPTERPADDDPTSTEPRQVSNWNVAQRADHAAHRDGAVLRLGAAARRRRLGAWRCVAFALFVVAMITDKIDGDIARKPQPGHRLRQDRRPDRRQGDHRHGLHRPLDRRRHLVVGDDRRAAPRVERDPAAALGPQARRDRRPPQSGKIKTVLQAVALSGLLPAAAAR